MRIVSISRTITAAAVVVPLALFGATVAFATGGHGHEKVGICHRTNSDSNPFVYLEVPKAEANGHIAGTDKSHNTQGRWKSDGTWQGAAHQKGDEKHDYFADSKSDCAATPVTTTTTGGTPSETTSTTSSDTSSSTTSQSSTSSTTGRYTEKPPTGRPTRTSSPTSSHHAKPPKPPKKTTAVKAPSSRTSSGPTELAFTGAGETAGYIIVALLLIGFGVWFYRASNRRR